MKPVTLTLDERYLLREIAEERHEAGIEVFETEVYDDLGRWGLELAGAASIVLARLAQNGPIEFSDELLDPAGLVIDWFDSYIDSCEEGSVRHTNLVCLKAKLNDR